MLVALVKLPSNRVTLLGGIPFGWSRCRWISRGGQVLVAKCWWSGAGGQMRGSLVVLVALGRLPGNRVTLLGALLLAGPAAGG